LISDNPVNSERMKGFLPYLVHLRPRSWPTVAGHVLAGALMAGGVEMFVPPAAHLWWRALAGAFLWAVCLNGGTLAFNSAIDRDEGDVGFLDNPPRPPRGLAFWGLFVMGSGAVGAWFLGPPFLLIYLISVFLSWVYSAPPVRLKTRGGWDVVVNMIGYGALTALAGWLAVSGWPEAPLDLLIFVGFGFLFGAVYPMTQFYQREEDERKGARTLALVLGVRGSMVFIHVCLVTALLCWVVAALGREWDSRDGLEAGLTAAQIAWKVRPLSSLGWFALLFQAEIWIIFAAHWWITFERYPLKKGLYRAMVLWAFSNLCLVIAFGGL